MPNLCNCIHTVLFDDMSKYIIHFLLYAISSKKSKLKYNTSLFLLHSVSQACEGSTIKCKYNKM